MGRHPRSIGRVQEDSSLIYSVYRAHRSVSNRAEPRDIDDARPLTRRRWSAVSERDDDRTEMEIVEFALI